MVPSADARHHQHRQREIGDPIRHRLRFIDRNQQSARAFDDPSRVAVRHRRSARNSVRSIRCPPTAPPDAAKPASATARPCRKSPPPTQPQPPHRRRVVIDFDAGLDRFPIPQRRDATIAMHQRRGRTVLPTPVSVPVTKSPSCLWRQPAQRQTGRAPLRSAPGSP